MTEINFLIDQSIQEMANLNQTIANLCEHFYQTLPLVEEDILMATRELQILIDYFLDSDQAAQQEIHSVVDNIFSNLTEVLEQFKNNETLVQYVSRLSQEDGVGFHSLLQIVKDTHRLLRKAEMTSFNSLIFSEKLGSEGMGLKVIASELNSLVKMGKSQYEALSQKVEELEGHFQQFYQETSQLFAENSQDLMNTIVDRQEELSEVQGQLKHVAGILQGVLQNIHEGLAPIQTIMARIQIQDIYRQTMESIVEILSVLKEEYLARGFTDDPAYYRQSVELVQEIFQQNQAQLQSTFDQLAADFEGVSATLQSINQDSVYIRYFLVGDGEEGPVLKKILARIYQVVDLFQEITQGKDQTATVDYSVLVQEMAEVKGQMGQVVDRFEQLTPIRVLTKMEIARLDVGQDFEAKISQITQEILETGRENLDQVERVITEIETELTRLEAGLGEERETAGDTAGWIERVRRQLALVEQFLSEAVHNITYSIEKLHIEIESIYQRLQGSGHQELVVQVMEGLDELVDRVTDISAEEKGGGDAEGKERLEAMVAKLKTSLERKAANQVVGLTLEAGSQGGELTLF